MMLNHRLQRPLSTHAKLLLSVVLLRDTYLLLVWKGWENLRWSEMNLMGMGLAKMGGGKEEKDRCRFYRWVR